MENPIFQEETMDETEKKPENQLTELGSDLTKSKRGNI